MAIGIAVLCGALIGCTATLVMGGTSETHPAALGVTVPGVVVYIEPRPGDRVELISAEPIGTLQGADVIFFLSRPVREHESMVIGERLEPLEGAVVEVDSSASAGPGNTVGVVVQLRRRQPGRYDLTGVRLRYRLNGGDETMQETTTFFRVCANDPAPDDCPSPED